MEVYARCWRPQEAELIKAVIANDLERVKGIIYNFQDSAFIDDLGWCNKPLPLYYLTLFNEQIWRYPDQCDNVKYAEQQKLFGANICPLICFHS